MLSDSYPDLGQIGLTGIFVKFQLFALAFHSPATFSGG